MAIKASDNFKVYKNPNGPDISTLNRPIIENYNSLRGAPRRRQFVTNPGDNRYTIGGHSVTFLPHNSGKGNVTGHNTSGIDTGNVRARSQRALPAKFQFI